MFEELLTALKEKTKLQKTPINYTDDDYTALLLDGIRTLYIDLGWEEQYSIEFDEKETLFTVLPSISEREYILLSAQIGFYSMIQQDVNTMIGYTTDTLSITNADKPYANISNEINRLESRRSELFHKIRAMEEE